MTAKQVREIALKYVNTLWKAVLNPNALSRDMPSVDPQLKSTTFALISLMIAYGAFKFLWPDDPISQFELPKRVKAIISLANTVPLGIPLSLAVLILYLILFPYLLFKIFLKKVSISNLITYAAYYYGGPFFVCLMLIFGCYTSICTINYGITYYIFIVSFIVIFIYSFIWQVHAMSTATSQTKLLCTIVLILSGVISSFLSNHNIFATYIIVSNSMAPTLENHHRVISNNIIYKYREPKRGEIAVYYEPEDSKVFVGRIIGIPGDNLSYYKGQLQLNGRKIALDSPDGRQDDSSEKIEQIEKLSTETSYKILIDKSMVNENIPIVHGDYHVPDNNYFIMGDNRYASYDSRAFGPVSKAKLIGNVYYRMWPLDKSKL